MEHDNDISNTTENRSFQDVLTTYLSRRKVLRGGLTVAAGSFFANSLAFANSSTGSGKKLGDRSLINFLPVTVAEGTGPVPSISADYQYQVLIPWGESLTRNVASYEGDPSVRPSADDQAKQIGIGHDGMHFFAFRRSNDRGLLVINHEYGDNSHLLGKAAPESLEDVLLSQHAHGVSVVEIKKSKGKWALVKDSLYNRRIHVNTPVEFGGPAQGDPLIAPEDDARGTVNNCANGYTPWGTYLTCEENFNGYFGTPDTAWQPNEQQARYGFTNTGFGYGWEGFDSRFDLASAMYPNEDNRFGWVVEIDPFNPNAKPVKRTALGRFKHEGIALVEGQGGRLVGYMGDDQAFDYIYKFVSESNWKSMRARGMNPLDHGTLYVAKFYDDGRGEWLELSMRSPLLAAKFSSLPEILTYARLAADAVGATPMDRPEWTTVAPNGDVYCTLTNNSSRTTSDGPNPLAPNPDGHIIRWKDNSRHTGTSFRWEIFIVADSTHGENDERTFSDPDGLWVDPDGRMFIQTDGGQKKGLNNQMLVVGTRDSGELDVRRLFSGVTDDEITGITVTPDRRTMFINTQHPGNGDPAKTNFPAEQGSGKIPRDCTFVITRKDGGIIGS